MYGQDILCGISKEPFEIPHKISYHTLLKDVWFVEKWRFKKSEIYELVSIFHYTWGAPQVFKISRYHIC